MRFYKLEVSELLTRNFKFWVIISIWIKFLPWNSIKKVSKKFLMSIFTLESLKLLPQYFLVYIGEVLQEFLPIFGWYKQEYFYLLNSLECVLSCIHFAAHITLPFTTIGFAEIRHLSSVKGMNVWSITSDQFPYAHKLKYKSRSLILLKSVLCQTLTSYICHAGLGHKYWLTFKSIP